MATKVNLSTAHEARILKGFLKVSSRGENIKRFFFSPQFGIPSTPFSINEKERHRRVKSNPKIRPHCDTLTRKTHHVYGGAQVRKVKVGGLTKTLHNARKRTNKKEKPYSKQWYSSLKLKCLALGLAQAPSEFMELGTEAHIIVVHHLLHHRAADPIHIKAPTKRFLSRH